VQGEGRTGKKLVKAKDARGLNTLLNGAVRDKKETGSVDVVRVRQGEIVKIGGN